MTRDLNWPKKSNHPTFKANLSSNAKTACYDPKLLKRNRATFVSRVRHIAGAKRQKGFDGG